MKTITFILAALLLTSVSAELITFDGQDDDGEACSVTIQYHGEKVINYLFEGQVESFEIIAERPDGGYGPVTEKSFDRVSMTVGEEPFEGIDAIPVNELLELVENRNMIFKTGIEVIYEVENEEISASVVNKAQVRGADIRSPESFSFSHKGKLSFVPVGSQEGYCQFN